MRALPPFLRIGVGLRPLWFTGVWPVVCHKMLTSTSLFEGQVSALGMT